MQPPPDEDDDGDGEREEAVRRELDAWMVAERALLARFTSEDLDEEDRRLLRAELDRRFEALGRRLTPAMLQGRPEGPDPGDLDWLYKIIDARGIPVGKVALVPDVSLTSVSLSIRGNWG